MPIFISQALYLSGDLTSADTDPNNPRVGYHDLLESGSLIADSELPDHPATNIQNPSTGEYWISADDTSTQYLTFLVVPQNINYFAIAGQDLVGATLKLQRRDAEVDPWSDVTLPVITENNEAIMWLFETVVTSAFWRLEIIPLAGNAPRVAVAYLGKYTTLQRRVYVGHEPSNYAVNSSVTSNMSEKSQFMGRTVTSQDNDFNLAQINVSPVFYRSIINPLRKHAIVRPFFCAWRPAEYPDEVAFLWDTQKGGIRLKNTSPNGFGKFDIIGKALAPLV